MDYYYRKKKGMKKSGPTTFNLFHCFYYGLLILTRFYVVLCEIALDVLVAWLKLAFQQAKMTKVALNLSFLFSFFF
jgi:hypothetical protein